MSSDDNGLLEPSFCAACKQNYSRTYIFMIQKFLHSFKNQFYFIINTLHKRVPECLCSDFNDYFCLFYYQRMVIIKHVINNGEFN